MRILWHGVAPWQPTGYGQQAAIWATRFRDAGHEVVIAAQGGNDTCQIMDWEGISVFPQAKDPVMVDMVSAGWLARFRPDVVIVCYSQFNMGNGEVFKPYQTLAWTPVDTQYATTGGKPVPGAHGVASGDRKWLADSGARPVAMSHHGKRMLEHDGWEDVPLIHHGIRTGVFRPLEPGERATARREFGIPEDVFAVGLLADNEDPHRKAIPEQVDAFARFHVKHPRSQIHIHSQVFKPGSNHLGRHAAAVGLTDEVARLRNQFDIFTGMVSAESVARWYGCMDVVMNCSRGEGFGLAAVEAQACGTPVILTDAHTGPELVGPGWLVRGQQYWNAAHEAQWTTPDVKDMVAKLNLAHAEWLRGGERRRKAREFALRFDVEEIWPLWEKLLAEQQ